MYVSSGVFAVTPSSDEVLSDVSDSLSLTSADESASFTAFIIPSELKVAPETADTSVDCLDIMELITVFFARLKNSSSSMKLSMVIEFILPFSTVTFTLVLPLNPTPDP